MIAKMSKSSKNIANSLAYVLNEEKGCEIIASGLYDTEVGVKENAQLWNNMMLMNTRIKNKLQHYVISHSEEDTKRMTPEAEQKILGEFFRLLEEKKGINLDASPYILVAHRSQSKHLHYHLLRLTVGYDGKHIKDNMVGLKLRDAAIEASHILGLEQPKRTQAKIERIKAGIEQKKKPKFAPVDRRKAIDDANKRKLERIAYGSMPTATTNREEFKADSREMAEQKAMDYLYSHTANWQRKRMQHTGWQYDDTRKCDTAKFGYAEDHPNYVLLQSYVNGNYIMTYTTDAEQRELALEIERQRKILQESKQQKTEKKPERKRSRNRNLNKGGRSL